MNYWLGSPLDQFEIRDLISLKASIIFNGNISLTNLGLYLLLGLLIVILFNENAVNLCKVVSTK